MLTAVVTLLASFYAHNSVYSKGLCGQSKNVFLFLEYILLPEIRNSQATVNENSGVRAKQTGRKFIKSLNSVLVADYTTVLAAI